MARKKFLRRFLALLIVAVSVFLGALAWAGSPKAYTLTAECNELFSLVDKELRKSGKAVIAERFAEWAVKGKHASEIKRGIAGDTIMQELRRNVRDEFTDPIKYPKLVGFSDCWEARAQSAQSTGGAKGGSTKKGTSKKELKAELTPPATKALTPPAVAAEPTLKEEPKAELTPPAVAAEPTSTAELTVKREPKAELTPPAVAAEPTSTAEKKEPKAELTPPAAAAVTKAKTPPVVVTKPPAAAAVTKAKTKTPPVVVTKPPAAAAVTKAKTPPVVVTKPPAAAAVTKAKTKTPPATKTLYKQCWCWVLEGSPAPTTCADPRCGPEIIVER